MWMAVDAMSGDHGPTPVVAGAVAAARKPNGFKGGIVGCLKKGVRPFLVAARKMP